MNRFCTILFCVFLLASCKTKDSISKTTVVTEDMIAESTVNVENIKGHIFYLASDELRGRDTPSPELNIAARYIATSLMRYGVKKAPGMNDYLQKVPMKKVKPANGGSLVVEDLNLPITDGFLMLRGDNVEVESEMVFLNYGTAEDFEGSDVRGKLVVAMCGYEGQTNPQEWFFAGSEKRQKARDMGAKGLIEIYANPRVPYRFLINFFNAPRTVLDVEDEETAFPHIWVNGSEAQTVSKLRGVNNTKGNLSISGIEEEEVETYNVIGMVEGSDPKLKDEFIIYSAHYDHVGVGRANAEGDSIYNGARDNAVGTTTVLMAAENIAKFPTKRSALFVFFTGEEKGLLGSSYYADHPVIPLDQVNYCFNSDNAGYNDTSRVSIIGLERTLAQPLFEKACARFGLKAMADSAPEQGLFDRSDNVNFAKKGVPAPTFSLGYTAFDEKINEYYHQAGDNPETLDYKYLEKFFKSYVYSCRLIANTNESVFWREGDKYYDAGKELYKKVVRP